VRVADASPLRITATRRSAVRLIPAAPALLASLLLLALVALPRSAAAEVLAPGLEDHQVVAGVDKATIARFAPDGEVFVAAQDGRVVVFPNVTSTVSTQVLNLGVGGTEEVVNEDDRGLLGMAVDPAYPSKPYVYLLFTYNAPPGQLAPFWKPEVISTSPFETIACPTPPGPEVDGCTVTGRLVRITIDQTTHAMVPGSETALIKDDWCQQFTSHSVGDLQFGPEGALYVSAGAGGDWKQADYGQLGGTEPNTPTPENPCEDPIEGTPGAGQPGLNQNQPTPEHPTKAEGGMLRSQSFRRSTDQPATLDGTIARVDPATGEPLPDNPNISSSDLDRRRIVAYGLRQPFRFVFRPEHEHEIWLGDVGQNTWEEIDRAENILSATSPNFGWPCFEGKEPEPDSYGHFFTESNLCKTAGPVQEPVYAYKHTESVVPSDGCPVNAETVGSAITAIGFQYGGPYRATYEHALFFGDYARDCMWAMLPNSTTGLPDPTKIQLVFRAERSEVNPGSPVDLEVGPEKNLYYVNRDFGELRRLSDSEYPTAVVTADHPTGVGPLTVTFSAGASSAPDPNPTYSWDFGDGSAASAEAAPSHAYSQAGRYTATLTVHDNNGNSDSTSMLITVGRPLQAVASADRTEGVGSLAVRFTGHESTAPDSIATYHWDFGDGTSAETVDASHTYTTPGAYTATLTVTDPGHVLGSQPVSSASVHVTVTLPSPAPVTSPSSPLTMTIQSEPPVPLGILLSGLRLDGTRFAAATTSSLRKPVRHRGYTTGTTLRFTISQSASVTVSFFRRLGSGRTARWVSVSARGVVSVCKTVAGKGHGRSHKVCRRPSSDHLALSARAGANAYVLSGWVGGVALGPGSYRMTLQASGAKAGPLLFTVVAPRSSRH
jgi:PKD repeat protein/glucose/arabinose dehydrogenase